VFPGYLVIRDSDIPEVFNQSAPTIHGKVYQSVFGSESSVSSDQIAGEGFSIQDGVFKSHSYTFNAADTQYNDRVKGVAYITLGPIQKVVDHWMKSKSGARCEQNYTLLSLFDQIEDLLSVPRSL
jgi:hypothetical protein